MQWILVLRLHAWHLQLVFFLQEVLLFAWFHCCQFVTKSSTFSLPSTLQLSELVKFCFPLLVLRSIQTPPHTLVKDTPPRVSHSRNYWTHVTIHSCSLSTNIHIPFPSCCPSRLNYTPDLVFQTTKDFEILLAFVLMAFLSSPQPSLGIISPIASSPNGTSHSDPPLSPVRCSSNTLQHCLYRGTLRSFSLSVQVNQTL